jgi:hypothetical protein
MDVYEEGEQGCEEKSRAGHTRRKRWLCRNARRKT